MAIVDNIYQVFKNYYGEDKVDLQIYDSRNINLEYIDIPSGSSVILVHWPTVTVTNEVDMSVDIWDLYCAICISPLGNLLNDPRFIRSTYDMTQWSSDYMHSHVPGISKNPLNKFLTSCLGTGPIKETIRTLKNTGADLDRWNLFCWELDKYVTVESLSGGPYRKMQNIGQTGSSDREVHLYINPSFTRSTAKLRRLIKKFLSYIINTRVLPFSYTNNSYNIALSEADTILKLSNAFIDFYNNDAETQKDYSKRDLLQLEIIKVVVMFSGKIYTRSDYNVPIECCLGQSLFTFKGNTVTLQLKDFHKDYTHGEVLVLSIDLLSYIVTVLLKYVNLNYGRKGTINFFDEKYRII